MGCYPFKANKVCHAEQGTQTPLDPPPYMRIGVVVRERREVIVESSERTSSMISYSRTPSSSENIPPYLRVNFPIYE